MLPIHMRARMVEAAGSQHQQRRGHRHQLHHLLGMLRIRASAPARDSCQARRRWHQQCSPRRRAQQSSPASSRSSPSGGDRQWKTGAPEQRRRQHRKEGSHEVQLEHTPHARCASRTTAPDTAGRSTARARTSRCTGPSRTGTSRATADGLFTRRPTSAPMLLPRPRPMRNTARMIEKV